MENFKIKTSVALLSIAISSLLVSCAGDNDSNKQETSITDTALKEIIAKEGLTGNPITVDTPDISSKAAQLGMKLFYSKSLGGDRDSACVTCHHPVFGGGDNLSLSVGTEAENPDIIGPGRFHDISGTNFDAGPTVPRNAPTTFNLVGWDKVFFHDGRIESIGKISDQNGAGLEGIRTPDTALGDKDAIAGNNLVQAQARFPVTSPEEMKGHNHGDKNNQQIRDFLAQRLGGYGAGAGLLADSNFWLEKFRDTFNLPNGTAEDLITEQNISLLISEYERSQVFVDTPWKAYVEGKETAISESAKKGALLFFKATSEGGAGCSSCHSGDFFTDEGFHNLAMPQLGRGKGDGADGTNDFGRFRETQNEADKFAFRTPSLINVEVTGPWTHAGAYTSLEAVIKHHLDPQSAIANYDESQLTQTGIQSLDKLQANAQPALDAANLKSVNATLSDDQIGDLVAFMKALTDPCVLDRTCLAPWIPDSTTDIDPNGDQLNGIDQNNNLL